MPIALTTREMLASDEHYEQSEKPSREESTILTSEHFRKHNTDFQWLLLVKGAPNALLLYASRTRRDKSNIELHLL